MIAGVTLVFTPIYYCLPTWCRHGRKQMAKLIKRIVAEAEVQEKPYTIWDTEIKGFGLLVLPSGVKSYVFSYRTPHAVKRKPTIGKADAMTPDQARRKAE